ncbi:MAG: hypothetical protein ACO280_04640 [Pseudohongiellaceae bacterium]
MTVATARRNRFFLDGKAACNFIGQISQLVFLVFLFIAFIKEQRHFHETQAAAGKRRQQLTVKKRILIISAQFWHCPDAIACGGPFASSVAEARVEAHATSNWE